MPAAFSVFKGMDARQPASIRLGFEGTGSLAYQVVGRSYIPWDEKPPAEPLSINIAYDRTRLSQNDIDTETVTIRNNLIKTANMVMVDLGSDSAFSWCWCAARAAQRVEGLPPVGSYHWGTIHKQSSILRASHTNPRFTRTGLYDGLPTCPDRLYASFTRKPDLSAPSNNSSISSSDFPFVSGRRKAAMRK
jgi:hypothetical protein